MNKHLANYRLLKECILICMGMCLLFALAPLTDFDFDGSPDSFLTDGLLMIASPIKVLASAFLLTRLLSAYLGSPKLFSYLVTPPPIAL